MSNKFIGIPDLESKTANEIIQFQEMELRKLLRYLSKHSIFYQNVFKANQIDIKNINLQNLSKIPPTTKEDLQANNFDFLCVEKKQIAEYFATSGTLGNPVTIALSNEDLDRLAHNEYLSFQKIGCNESDVFQLMVTMDKQFMAGIAYYTGIQKLGASVIRIGSGNEIMQLESIIKNQPTVLIAVPSFIKKMITYAEKNNINLNTTSVKKLICIGESIRNNNFEPNELAKSIKKHWNIQLFSTYASTEKQTAFTECGFGNGNHVHSELMIFEILDDQNQILGEGEFGELTITTLGVKGMPLLRFKTGDICSFYTEPCQCGRNSYRISQIIGRNQQLIKYRGTTLYPPTIFNVLNGIVEIEDYFITLFSNEYGLDDLNIYISIKQNRTSFIQNINKRIQSALRVLPNIHFVNNNKIIDLQTKASNRKIIKFIDERI
ncbi:MAG: AMP-binding protein [Bacteroidetes bacterium]|nr:AMP-binding protein [Bacteroidota bacterium]